MLRALPISVAISHGRTEQSTNNKAERPSLFCLVCPTCPHSTFIALVLTKCPFSTLFLRRTECHNRVT